MAQKVGDPLNWRTQCDFSAYLVNATQGHTHHIHSTASVARARNVF